MQFEIDQYRESSFSVGNEFKDLTDAFKMPPIRTEIGSIGYLGKMILACLVVEVKPKLIVETGTFLGVTASFLAELIILNSFSQCLIASFDFPEVIDKLKESNPSLIQHPQVKLIKGNLPQALNEFLKSINKLVDLAIIDAQHSYEAVCSELKIVHACIAPEGYIFCHDYRPRDKKYSGVVRAVDEFAAEYKYNILPGDSDRFFGSAILSQQKLSHLKDAISKMVGLNGNFLCGEHRKGS